MKKTFDEKIHSTVEEQDKALERRFDNIDSLLLKSISKPKENSAPKALVVRDTFSMPENDHALIAALIAKGLKAGRATSKSEVVRAGLHVLNGLDSCELLKTFNCLEKLIPGRKL